MIQYERMQPYLIGVAGPSGAGKSVFCKLMQNTFKGISRLKLDDFFKDIEDVPRIGNAIRWDDPESIKWDKFIAAVRSLKSGKYALVPNYSRKENRQIGEKCVFPSDIILIDGFMSLVPEELRQLLDLKLYFRLSEDSQVKRRRERQPEVTDEYLYNVMLPVSRTHVMPSAQYADYIINAELSLQGVTDQGVSIVRHTLQDRIKKLDHRKIFDNINVKAKV